MFVVGMALVVMAVTGLAVDGTRAFLLRRTLQNAADSAALAGANSLDETSYYATGGAQVVLDPASARATAARWLAARGFASGTVDAAPGRIRVVVRAEVPTTFLRLVRVSRIRVAAESVAEPLPGAP